jgi:hypothetical protein
VLSQPQAQPANAQQTFHPERGGSAFAVVATSNRTAAQLVLSKKTLKALTKMLKEGKPGVHSAALSLSVDVLNQEGVDIQSCITRAFPHDCQEIVGAFDIWNTLHGPLEAFRDASGFNGDAGRGWRDHLAGAADDSECTNLMDLSSGLEFEYAQIAMNMAIGITFEDWVGGSGITRLHTAWRSTTTLSRSRCIAILEIWQSLSKHTTRSSVLGSSA